jgi:hypothetical protein
MSATTPQSTAIAAIVTTGILVVALTIGVIVYSTSLGDNFYPVLAACIGLFLCIFPPSVAGYINLTGTAYSYENYILQVFVPMSVGFLLFIAIVFFDVLKNFDDYHESSIIMLASASILSSALIYTFMLYRIKYHGT